eukprot:TRINITY_DN763_c0_g2_i1.p1 TRINITY_DN763_c0_g2~~TRINITY_DN763_c0_g2_i1.p1  ORF type:complete len:1212 (-),score=185.21 TRINITY_DN763_c0_g2_i1:295-3930(-)
MTGHANLNKDCGSGGLSCDNISSACKDSTSIRCQNNIQSGKTPKQIECEDVTCCKNNESVAQGQNCVVGGGCQMRGQRKEVDHPEQIFINNGNGQRKGCLTLLVKEQQCQRSSKVYLKPQDPRLQFKSTNTNNLQKEGDETNASIQQKEQSKNKRRLGFGQSLNRKDDRNTATKPVLNPGSPKSKQPLPQKTAAQPKFTMPPQWYQKFQSCQEKSTDAKHNLLQISKDLDLLASELEEVNQHGDQLQFQILEIERDIERLDEYPEEGELEEADDGEDSSEDDESLTSAHLPLDSSRDGGEEVDQKLQQNLYYCFSDTYNNNNDVRRSFKSVVNLLRVRKIAQSRQNSNLQISETLKEENLLTAVKNNDLVNSLMPVAQTQICEKKTPQLSSDNQKSSLYLKNFMRSYHSNQVRLSLVYRRQMLQYKKFLRDSNLEDDDDELDTMQPKFMFNSFKYKSPKMTKFRTLRSTELAHSVKIIKRGITIPNQTCENHPYGKWLQIRSKFIGCKSKIYDPIGEMNQELIASPWTDDQKNLFVQIFLQYPKEFEKIASFIPGRTSRECIAFYYRNQKQEWFAPTKRKLHLMRRQRRQDLRKAESFMQISKASQQRMNNAQQNNTSTNVTNNEPKSINITENSKILTKVEANRVSEKVFSVSSVIDKSPGLGKQQQYQQQQQLLEGPKSLFKLTGAQRGQRSKRKRATEVSIPKLLPLSKRKYTAKTPPKIQASPASKQKQLKVQENMLAKEGLSENSSPTTSSTVVQNKRSKFKEQQEKSEETCTNSVSKCTNFVSKQTVRSKRVRTRTLTESVSDIKDANIATNNNYARKRVRTCKLKDSVDDTNDSITREKTSIFVDPPSEIKDQVQNGKKRTNQWESIREPLQIPPLFKNGGSTTPFKPPSFFTDLLQPLQKRAQASLFVPPHINKTISKSKNDNKSDDFYNNHSGTDFLQPSLTSLLEETMHQALGETTSLFHSTNSLFQFGGQDLVGQMSCNNRPSASSSPGSFTLGRSPTLVEIQKQLQQQQQQQQKQSICLQQSGPAFPPRKFESSSSKFPFQNSNLGLSSRSIFDQVFSSQTQSRIQPAKKHGNNSSFFLREQLQQQLLQGSCPQIQQFGQKIIEQQQQQQQQKEKQQQQNLLQQQKQQQQQQQIPHSINNLDSILEKGSSGFSNNSLRQFPLDQYLFGQLSEGGGLKCAGGFDRGASNRNMDGDSFNGL